MEASPAYMVAMVQVDSVGDELFDCLEVVLGNSSEKLLGLLDVDLLAPLANIDGVEASSHRLPTRILLNEPKSWSDSG